ncbi:DNA-processing protein DprA [Frigidibacter sp. RF13]|uniref:DNA-processing protein DprA n=1 Tax=Frigidibacter sp. RF13 TaxID=2997340 RepID=UPI002270F0EB|nr:DNA-processing protein DprA [Frigidibacter sp. RF13]MCY1127021.1 DNA-processing protein DprA [Frigidibacter sp. RF13]
MFSYPTPFTPPTTEEDRLSWLRLIRSRRVGPSTFWRLLSEHGSAPAALLALPDLARAAGVEGYEPCPEGVALAEMKAARRAGAKMILKGDGFYPADLARLSDAPPLLWALGDPGLMARPMVALVGARNASSLGTRMARRLAEGLGAAGVAVVSGLARGIDAAAHAASVETGTVAVLAGGVDVIYPAENAGLAGALHDKGLLLSEQPMGLEPLARHFPLRNRIISGLSKAVVVVEAAHASGSLITAKCALDQGREVLAVPGHPFDGRAGGCNALIRDGATLVRGPEDVLEALALDKVTANAPPRPQDDAAPAAPAPAHDMRALHQLILDRLGPSPLAEDQLLRDLSLTAAEAAPELLTLELDGRIQRAPGGLLSRI